MGFYGIFAKWKNHDNNSNKLRVEPYLTHQKFSEYSSTFTHGNKLYALLNNQVMF